MRPKEERRVLTVVFCDLKDSTVLGEQLDPEALGEVLDLYFTAMTRVLERHAGSVQKFIGDAVVAAFGIPVLHEDDALRAVRAAVDMRVALARLNQQLSAGYGVTLKIRIGIHTGDVVVRTAVNDQQVLTGDTLNTAARLEQAAGEDEILIGEPTLRLVRGAVETEPMPPLDLKGKSEVVVAHRLLRVIGDEQSGRLHDAPLVGREKELGALLAVLDRSTSERRCMLATVLGEAGVGKSRLVRELLADREHRATILRGRCLPYGEGITFWPLLEMVRDAAGVGPAAAPDEAMRQLEALADDIEIARRVGSAVGWTDEQLPMAELFWGVSALLERMAGQGPVTVVIDDVHWAAPALLELIEHLVDRLGSASVMIVCTARPDMLDDNPTWSEGPSAVRVVLEGLPGEAAAIVLDNRLAGVELPAAASERILSAADGNPLFVEQLVSMLIDTGILRETGGRMEMTREISALAVPPSIQALLSARLDMLNLHERSVVGPASVIGQTFPSAAIRELASPSERDEVLEHLSAVARKRLVRQEAVPEADGSDYRFQHALVRDAAYQLILKRGRADLHERYADWLERSRGEREAQIEMDEIVGYHLAQSYAYRTQLGVDEHVTVLGSRAAERLGAAGRRAFTRGDLSAATDLLGRAIATLVPPDPVRLALAADLAETLLERGEFERAGEVLDEIDAASTDPACAAPVARGRLVRLYVDLYAGQDAGWAEKARAEVERAISIFEAADDQVGLATAWRVHCNADILALEFDAGLDAAERIITHANAAGDTRQQRRGAVAYSVCAVQGSTPVDQAIARCEDLIATVEGDRRTEAVVQGALAQLHAMNGTAAAARTAYTSARGKLVRLGKSVVSASTSLDSGPAEMILGDLVAAEANLRRDYDELEGLGETYLRSTIGGLLSYVCVLEGRWEEAEVIAAAVRQMAGPDDVDAQVLWRRSLARRRAAQRRFDEAASLATEAVELTSDSAPVMRAYALVDRALVLAADGRDGAAADFAAAIGLHVAKGNRAAADAVTRVASESAGIATER